MLSGQAQAVFEKSMVEPVQTYVIVQASSAAQWSPEETEQSIKFIEKLPFNANCLTPPALILPGQPGGIVEYSVSFAVPSGAALHGCKHAHSVPKK
jgi:hypothetical protein